MSKVSDCLLKPLLNVEHNFPFYRPTPSDIITFGICGPATCSPELLREIVIETLEESNIDYVSRISIAPISCQRKTELQFRTRDVWAM